MLSPTSVTSDGTRLFVTDLGYNRVLIWNTIPTTNQAPANVEIGQSGHDANDLRTTPRTCARRMEPIATGPLTYPARCALHSELPALCAIRRHALVRRRRRQRPRPGVQQHPYGRTPRRRT